MSGKIDDKHTTRAGQIAHVETATAGDNSPLAVGEPQTEAGSVGATLLEGMKQLGALSLGQSAALVLNLNPDAIPRSDRSERHCCARSCELHRVLKKVGDRGSEISRIADNLSVIV